MEDRRTPDTEVGEIKDVVRIDDPEVDVEALVDRIRRNLASRPPLSSDVATLLRMFDHTPDGGADGDLVYSIERLALMLEVPIASDRMRPSHGWMDRRLNTLRRPFHDLVRFYVDAHAARLDEVIRRVHAALAALYSREDMTTTRFDALGDDAATLRSEVAGLRDEVARLRAMLEGRSSAESNR